MRHGKKIAHLGRKTPHRKYMLANMACSLIEHKSINTTVAKAKALKKYIEPLITKSKSDSTHNRRIVFSYLKNKYAVTELFRDISVKIGDRPGGYTRIIKLGNRLGDNASMAMIELVDYNTIYNSGTDSAKKTRRRKKSSKKSNVIVEESPAPVVEESAAPVVEESAVPVVEESAAPGVEESTAPGVEESTHEIKNNETNQLESDKKETDS
ncbi:MAG: 50S ribosomal protein L17 [Flavobacteriales bacterium]|nr:50S ribosomal protein L17 [Flavobacteriaceae bacterium]RZP09652.1 MAG: 50S ribosomal protein L17 [Flavobacteriales bacterium]|tara:strand:+ start:228 stop:860 length:633 start_codon:yes stop_codon:yes gene_type:complete